MLKIFVETPTGSTAIFKNDKIENNLENVENILTAVGNITGKKVWGWVGNPITGNQGKLVIELNLSGENLEKIEEEIKKLKKRKERKPR